MFCSTGTGPNFRQEEAFKDKLSFQNKILILQDIYIYCCKNSIPMLRWWNCHNSHRLLNFRPGELTMNSVSFLRITHEYWVIHEARDIQEKHWLTTTDSQSITWDTGKPVGEMLKIKKAQIIYNIRTFSSLPFVYRPQLAISMFHLALCSRQFVTLFPSPWKISNVF